MIKPKITIAEFDEFAKHISIGDSRRATSILNCFFVGQFKKPIDEVGRFETEWGYAALYLAGYVSGIRTEREKKRKKGRTVK